MSGPDQPANPPALDEDAVRRVAHLSRLAIDDDAVRRYTGQLGDVLGYIERLRELDLENVEPLSNPLDATNRVDEDHPREPLTTDALMDMAPEAAPPFVKVPKVLGEGA